MMANQCEASSIWEKYYFRRALQMQFERNEHTQKKLPFGGTPKMFVDYHNNLRLVYENIFHFCNSAPLGTFSANNNSVQQIYVCDVLSAKLQ